MSDKELQIAKVKEKNALLVAAHQKHIDTVEAARKEYVEAKKRIFPEDFAAVIAADKIKALEEKVALLEAKGDK